MNIKLSSLIIMVGLLFVGCSDQAPVPMQIDTPVHKTIDKEVSVTGAAGELKRLTYGGYEELVSQLSSDKKWLLIDTYGVDSSGEKNTNYIMQKLNVKNNQRMILTPENSNNYSGVWYKNDSKIIFTTERLGKPTIAISMGVEGENGVRFVTNNSLGEAYDPDVNSKCNDIVFSLNGNIAMIKPNGTQIRMFGSGMYPKYSSDDSKVLFIRKVGNYRHIFVMNINGTGLVQLTSETSNDYYAVWSPDSKYIAFISDRVMGKKHLFVMKSDGSEVAQLTEGNFDVSSVDWGNDGYLYFSANAGGNKDIWMLKPKLNNFYK